MRDVTFVDYSRPGFAVVWAEAGAAAADELVLTIASDRVATRLEPEVSAVGAAGRLVVENRTDREHIVSYPVGGVVGKLAAGGSLTVDIGAAGEQQVFLLDVPSTGTTFFAAPGPYAVVSSTGRFVLSDLAPGPTVVRTWHPRFPSSSRPLELVADAPTRLDLEIGVGHTGEHSHAH